MPDDRPLRDKLLAMASQTTSPAEAEVARAILARLHPIPAPRGETPGGLTRAAIFGAPDRTGPAIRAYRVHMPSGWWVTLDEDEVPWAMVGLHHLEVQPA
jgi:hypothetical protein